MDHAPQTGHDGGTTQGHASGAARSDRLMGVDQVMARYGLRDRRTAPRVMDAAGAFVVARRLYVREADLVAYEVLLRTARRRGPRSPDPPNGDRARRRPTPRPARDDPLPPGWWREDAP